MKKSYKDYWIDYYVDICRKYKFYIGLIKYKLENHLKLTRDEEEILSGLEEYYYEIQDLERVDDDEK